MHQALILDYTEPPNLPWNYGKFDKSFWKAIGNWLAYICGNVLSHVYLLRYQLIPKISSLRTRQKDVNRVWIDPAPLAVRGFPSRSGNTPQIPNVHSSPPFLAKAICLPWFLDFAWANLFYCPWVSWCWRAAWMLARWKHKHWKNLK